MRTAEIASAQDDWVGTMTDVHELRGLQERQHVLLAELQHRSRKWKESGVQMPDASQPRRYGYGTELIERALPYQLRARTLLEFDGDGVRCLLELPVFGDEPGAGGD